MSERPQFIPTEDGPYRVEGATTIVRLADGKEFEVEGTTYLCRCGGSENKPFCDGHHAHNGFTGAKDPDRVPDQLDVYASDDARITIHDNRGLCAHAGACTNNLSSTFKTDKEPFVDPNGSSPDEIATVIPQCPSGALNYELDNEQFHVNTHASSIAFAPNGPYVLKNVDLVDDEPEPAGANSERRALCRCGASKNKPYCSGAHWYVDFDEDATTGHEALIQEQDLYDTTGERD